MKRCDLTKKQARTLYAECQEALDSVHKKVQARLCYEKEPNKRAVLPHLAALMAL